MSSLLERLGIKSPGNPETIAQSNTLTNNPKSFLSYNHYEESPASGSGNGQGVEHSIELPERPKSPFPTSSGRILKKQKISRAEILNITVGSGETSKVFQLKKHQVCTCSEYFAAVYVSHRFENVDFANDNPTVFGLFSEWIQNPSNSIVPAQEPWFSNAAEAWVLASKLQSEKFERYALLQFTRNCALIAFGPWDYIEKNAPPKSSIRLFSDHWVSWNFSLLAKANNLSNEYSGLQAVTKAKFVTPKTVDPRVFDIDHWFSSCGEQLEPSCSHNTQPNRDSIRPVSIRNLPQHPEWGRSFELQRNNQNSITLPSRPPSPPSHFHYSPT